MRTRLLLAHSFEGPIHCGQEATVAGACGSWLHRFHGPNAERNEQLYPAHLLCYILSQGTVPRTVVSSFHLNARNQDSPLQVCLRGLTPRLL